MPLQSSQALPIEALQVIELFQAQQDALRFPDVDADSLARSADSARVAAQAVADAEKALLSAQNKHREATDRLMRDAKRGLAYARIYAEDDPELMEEISELSLARPRKRDGQGSRLKKRPRKSDASKTAESQAAELPFSADRLESSENSCVSELTEDSANQETVVELDAAG